MYAVKETFLTIQGEGILAGRVAVFCRFTGCNLWSGLEKHRSSAACRFCDTDFVGTDGEGGGRFADAKSLVDHIAKFWPIAQAHKMVVLTGGEPMLQVDEPLIKELYAQGFFVSVETNGTQPIDFDIDHVCVSPKGNNTLVVTRGDELKLVYPQEGVHPTSFEALDFAHWSLQPKDDEQHEQNTKEALRYCLNHPRWRLSVQAHKFIGIR